MRGILLSEFWRYRPLRKGQRPDRLNTRRWGALAAMCLWLWAWVTVFLGHLSNSNALRVNLETEIKTTAGYSRLPDVSYTVGYLAELSHGFFYLVLAPIFVFAAFVFLEAAEESFKSLDGSLLASRQKCSFSFHLARLNRRRFRKVLYWLLPVWIVIYLVGDSWSIYRNYSGTTHTLGFAKAPFTLQMQSYLNTGDTLQRYTNLPSSQLI